MSFLLLTFKFKFKSYHFLYHLVDVDLGVSLALKGDGEGLRGLVAPLVAELPGPAEVRGAPRAPVGVLRASVVITLASLAFVAEMRK